MATIVNCPTCGQPVEWMTDNKYRPFCSQRCKLIDLGQWADESYRLPAEDDVPSGDTPPPQSH